VLSNPERLDTLKEQLKKDGGKILVIQTAFLGDVVLLTALLVEIKKLFPLSRLYVVVIPECAGVLNGLVDEIIIFDKRKKEERKQRFKLLIDLIRAEKFALAFLPHRSLRSGWLAKAADIPIRIGFDRGPGRIFHTHKVHYIRSRYEGLRCLDLLSRIIQVDSDGLPVLKPTNENQENVNAVLLEKGLSEKHFVVYAPGSVWNTKAWPVQYYRQLSTLLHEQYGMQVIAVGGNADVDLCSQAVLRPELNLAGILSPLESSVLMSRARLVISGDTAPAHLATASGVNQLIIFGSTTPKFGFFPPTERARSMGVDLWCRPCTDHGRRNCPRGKSMPCLNRISPDDVIQSIGDWLAG
jgi:heptosyltransferase-2